MGGARSPILAPVAALVLGTSLALPATRTSVPAAGGLAILGAALGGPAGRATGLFAAGLLGVWLRPERFRPPAGFPEPGRPVTVTAELGGGWRRESFGWSAPIEARRLRQGLRVERWRRRVYVSLPGEARPAEALSLRLTGYLSRAPGYANGGEPRAGPWRLRVKSRRFASPAGGGGPLRELSRALRRRLEGVFARAGGGPVDAPGSAAATERAGPGLARALVLGDARAVPVVVRRGLRRAGLAHLLAVSGLHVGLLAAAGLLAGRRLPAAWRLLPVAFACGVYLLVVGPRPAILRASLMALLAAAALLLERRAPGPHALTLTIGVLVALDPGAVRDLSFLLTASATAGIVVLAPALVGSWSRLPPVLARPLAATVGAQLCALPFAAPAFHLLSPFAPLANLFAVPWTGFCLLAGFAWTALAATSAAAGRRALPLLDLAAAPFEALSALPPGPLLTLPVALSGAGAAALAAALAAGLLWPRRGGPAVLLPIALLALLGLLARLPAPPPAGRTGPRPARPAPELILLDVGQGDALLLRDGAAAALVDGGGWRRADFGGRVLLPALARLGVRRLEAVVLTHPDLDHCGGLVDIAGYLPVGEVWTAPGWGDEPCARDLLALPAVGLRTFWRGESAALGRWRLAALHPPAGDRSQGNDRSLVLLAEAGGRRLLLTGDLEARGERRLLAAGLLQRRVDVLKVAHHGSRTSTGSAFLSAVAPRLALISAGTANPYGHPSPAVVARLRGRGIPVLRTDRSGMVKIAFPEKSPMRIELHGWPR